MDFTGRQDEIANVIWDLVENQNKSFLFLCFAVGQSSDPAVIYSCSIFCFTTAVSSLFKSVCLPSQKRKTTTISVEVKKSQHKYIIGPKGNTLQEILEATGVSVEMPPLDSSSETIILRGEPDKLGPALTQVYAKVRRRQRHTCNVKLNQLNVNLLILLL